MKQLVRLPVVLIAVVMLATSVVRAETDGAGQAPAAPAVEAASGEAPVSVVVWGRPLVECRIPLEFPSVSERARAASRRVDELLSLIQGETIVIQPVQIGRGHGVMLIAGQHFLLSIMEGDLAGGRSADLEIAAHRAAEEIRGLVRDHAEQRSFTLVVRACIQAAVATVLYVVFWTGLMWARVRILRRVARSTKGAAPALRVFGYDWRPVLLGSLVTVTRLAVLTAILAGAYVWATFVLSRFPYTRHWGGQLGGYLTDAVGALASGTVHQIPNLVALVVIYLLTRGLVRVLNSWFLAIESGRHFTVWLDPEAARASRRLTDIAVWIVALIVAFPYLPGSHSEAFRGISVFLGLMLSLGGSGFVGQIIGGLAAVYSRSVRTGDFIRVGEVEGVVKELGMFSCKLVTRSAEEVTLPNSTLVNSAVRNLSRVNGNAAIVTTSVTIGYDTPWRQVQAMLLRAAAMTDGLLKEPAPRVLQTALDDFYVRYELNACAESAYGRAETKARLHAAIQDVFNENGVQIMSPHFRAQPATPVVVPRENWEPKIEASGSSPTRLGQ